ncbi:hypothetical protein A6R68_06918, partial [Neotoma lepida]
MSTGDITQYLLAKRKQLGKEINATFRGLNENLQSIFKTQQKSSQSCLHGLLAQQQMKTLQKAVEDHETKIENAKDLCDTFLKKAKDLSEHRKAFIGGEESEVRKEISKAQDRVIMET